MQRKLENSIQKLVDFTQLIQTTPIREPIVVKPENIIYGAVRKQFGSKNNGLCLYVQISNNIIEALEWKDTDRIAIFHDPNNLLKIYIIKSEHKDYKLKRSGKNFHGVTFPWKFQNECPLEISKIKPIDYEPVFNATNQFIIVQF